MPRTRLDQTKLNDGIAKEGAMDDKKTVTQRATERSSRCAFRPIAILVGITILIGIPSSSWLRADDTKPGPPAANSKTATSPAAEVKTLDLRIVGPDDKPVSGAKV